MKEAVVITVLICGIIIGTSVFLWSMKDTHNAFSNVCLSIYDICK